MNSDFGVNKEPLWVIPQPVRERLQLHPARDDYNNFLLSALYCAVALFFLVLFGFYSLAEGERAYAMVLFGFAGVTVACFAALWLSGWYWLGKHTTTLIMALLCLYLFYSGGSHNTGPMYYFVFPTVALFLQGRLRGLLAILLLLVITIILSTGALGFDVERYSTAFMSRLVSVTLIISVLTCIPEYFRIRAERNLLLSISDLETLTYGDMHTNLANRTFLEKLLYLEFTRHQRYGSDCCLLFVEADTVSRPVSGLKPEVQKLQQLKLLAEILQKNLRVHDVAGRWDNKRFLLVLPETNLASAKILADRLLQEIRAQETVFGKLPLRIFASIGLAPMGKSQVNEVLERATNNLLAAQRKGGNCYRAL